MTPPALLEIAGALLGLVFPRTCGLCGKDLPSEADPLCGRCVDGFPRWTGLACWRCGLPLPDGGGRCPPCRSGSRGFRFCRSAGLYEGSLQRAVLGLKFGGREALAPPLARFMWGAWRALRELAGVDLVIPVPLHFLRGHARGYNQAGLLGKSFAAAGGLAYGEGILRRRRFTRAQATLGREARLKNLADAFAVRRTDLVRGKNILLIDDVCTTGATLEACAAPLRRAGARRVDAFTLARRV